MPNENLPVCACGIVVDLPKSRGSSIVLEKLTILLPKSKSNKQEDKDSRKQQDNRRGQKTRTSSETGSSSLVTEPTKPTMKNNKHEKRLNHSRRTRSADSAESHYTYMGSSSNVLSDRIRENTAIPEVYAGIPYTSNANTEEIRTNRSNMQNRSQAFYTTIPSMTSPPPTYDVAIAKARQSGLPPTYEEYLYHKYAMKSRSHTPPPPWSDSTTSSSILSSNPTSSLQTHRDLLLSQPELREYLAQLTLDSHYQHQHQQQDRQQSRDAICSALREQQIRAHHRARAMPPRSQSESRAQQQRIAAMYEDAAFCMETTVLQSAFDSAQGFALCSLM